MSESMRKAMADVAKRARLTAVGDKIEESRRPALTITIGHGGEESEEEEEEGCEPME